MEVLVALAIIAFGLVAVFGQLSQSALAATRLRDKTLAHWVAIDRLTELRLSGAFPGVGTSSDDMEMANTRWHYEIRISATDTEDLRRADISVAFADERSRPLVTVTGFLAERRTTPPPATRWAVIDPDAGLPGEAQQTPETEPRPETANKADSGATSENGNAESQGKPQEK